MRHLVKLIVLSVYSTVAFGQLFINEIDYDQPGTDTGEFIEIAGPAGEYSNVSVDHINGNGGTLIWSLDIPTFTLSDESDGYGFYIIGAAGVPNTDITIPGSIQNGPPDGVVLKINSNIVDAVAYEGEMNDADGNPMESILGDFAGIDSSAGRIGIDGSPWVYGPNSPGSINAVQSFDPSTNYPPSANAGSDQTVDAGVVVTLDGSGSVDSDGTIASYLWTQVSGTTVTLTNANTAVASFTVPTVTETSSWVFSLTVTDDDGATGSDETAISVSITGEVANLAAFRNGIEGETYTIAGEVILTWVQTYRGQKYIQDGTAAILIDDYFGTITTDYSIGDGITGMSGTLGSYGNMLQFVPEVDPGAVSSTGNTIEPQTVTLANLTSNFEDYEGELVRVEAVSFSDAGGSFANGIEYGISDASGSFTFRTTFYDVDYIGTTIPNSPTSLVGIPNSRSDGDYISSRDMADLYYQGAVSTFENHQVLDPDFVTSGSEVTISIDIIPAEDTQTIASANILYGTDGTMLNPREMWLDSGDNWQGIIPAQPGNTLIEYQIEATTSTNEVSNSHTYRIAVASNDLTEIAAIQASPVVGQVVTVEGVITIGGDLLHPPYTKAYIQDASGHGINLFDFDVLPLNRGDLVRVAGVVDINETTTQILNFSYQLISTANDLPAPVILTPGEANLAQWEGTLIQVTGTISDTWAAGGGQNVQVANVTDTTLIRIWESTGVDISGLTIGTDWSFVGVESQYEGDFQMLVAYDEDITGTTGIITRNNQPDSFTLNPAYPNPFNPSTTLSWSISAPAEISLSVYDVRGREVARIAEGFSAAGTYSMTWDASALSSGVYFVQLTSPTEAAIQKVMLLK